MVDVEAKEIVVGAAAYETSTQIRSPATAEIRQQHGGGVFRPPKQRLTDVVLRIDGRGVLENFSRRVSVGRVEKHPGAKFGLQFDFGALRERTIHVDVLADEIYEIDLDIVDLVFE